MTDDQPVTRTRFAPSPTGFLHVGGVRTALFAWLVAKQANGRFILRIEDTDRQRHDEQAENHIKQSLEWLGLVWDEGPDKEGKLGPYRQSERLEIYQLWASKLIEKGRAYADPYSAADLAKLRDAAKAEKKPFLYRHSRPSTPPQWQPGLPPRFKSDPRPYSWQDEVLGNLSAGPESVDDFILIKSDGYPTYNFAHIVDDHLMKISHVIRSQEFLPSVPKFLNLYEALDIDRPTLATLPYVMGPDGNKKLSKRDGAKDVLDYQREGFLPEAVINFLASLGWNDGTEQEIFSRQELIEKFSLSRVQRGGARFDETRMLWMNGYYIRQLGERELSKLAEPYWPPSAEGHDQNYKSKVAKLVSERLRTLQELGVSSLYFFEKPDPQAVKKLYLEPVDKKLAGLPPEQLAQVLQSSIETLRNSDFTTPDLTERLSKLVEQLNSSPGIVFAAIRIAISGQAATPPIFDSLALIGKDESVQRLEAAHKLLSVAA